MIKPMANRISNRLLNVKNINSVYGSIIFMAVLKASQ
jgi:hypothetical protein